MPSEQLNVIALVSGGKDSFFSALHCQTNGHRLVALANLFPSASDATPGTIIYKPKGGHVNHVRQQGHPEKEAGHGADEDADLNSFMYQTVGHEVIPLYADATGLPLYRQPIYGGAKYEGRDYDSHAVSLRDDGAAPEADADETESMVPLLRAILADHPEANALCAGAILSTYQRTRVESVALRLGLTPLAYLWKYPVLPQPVPGVVEDAQLLHDMAAAGLDARIIKVASAGLDEDFLWERVSSLAGVARIKRALRRFGAAEGSVLGEGGEFETIVLDGPPGLFQKAIEVPDAGKRTVREGGGTSWLSLRGASVREKPTPDAGVGESFSPPRVPDVLDRKFRSLLDSALQHLAPPSQEVTSKDDFTESGVQATVFSRIPSDDIHWSLEAQVPPGAVWSVEQETENIVQQVRERLADHTPPLPTTAITNTIIALRSMSDFPAVNKIYARLFQHPNPPSRVTIACDLQPRSAINVHLTVKPYLEPQERNGLHVQSRSYWAPANIGPYSQAIDVPLSSRTPASPGEQAATSVGVRSVTIAGQIPLVPASMVLPTETTGNLEMQIILSLQHLWRVATEMKVQLWTSAVAYFPRTPKETDMRRQSSLAAAAWRGIHAPDEDEDGDDESGPDPWDRKYNPAYMSLGGGEGADTAQKLPDWSAIKGTADQDGERPVPPFFAVEVEELPRQAGVEWHAHTGLSRLASSSVEYQTFSLAPSPGAPFYRRVCHVVVSGKLVHTAISWLAIEDAKTKPPTTFAEVDDWMSRAYLDAVGSSEPVSVTGASYLMYINLSKLTFGASAPAESTSTACINARSILGQDGEQILALALFK
ncbi:Diphthine-ammonia ligase [Colletotrichum chlorophyti]|uniref:Diphthine--ammonia ligase n=1 Tax=Colletotrichum chlorophyti TaxID=708187 RepID=A0A1Q8RW77_9PEZI|nr:Diphthine-ammonia ligase [Colletotrichum chlorophyti]